MKLQCSSRFLILLLNLVVVLSFASLPLRVSGAEDWTPLFNGKDLSGWTPKIKGYELGNNYANTFRVENGAICVRYDGYTKFENKFGHLFYKEPFSNYLLRVEYRFTGSQLPDGPGWALRNSGVMIHCQPPATMGKDQDFPVCIEVQLLGGDGQHTRHTGNMCSPGTHIVMDGKLFTTHCLDSSSKTYHGDQWVTVEVEAHGNKRIIHRVNGDVVLTYEKPQYDPTNPSSRFAEVTNFNQDLTWSRHSVTSCIKPRDFESRAVTKAVTKRTQAVTFGEEGLSRPFNSRTDPGSFWS